MLKGREGPNVRLTLEPLVGNQHFIVPITLLATPLLSLAWFGVGMTTPGKEFGAAMEGRVFAFILLWPATMLAAWIFSKLALLLARCWLLASFSLPVAFAILYGIWIVTTMYMLNLSGVMFAAFFILLNIGALWLAWGFLKKYVKGNAISQRAVR